LHEWILGDNMISVLQRIFYLGDDRRGLVSITPSKEDPAYYKIQIGEDPALIYYIMDFSDTSLFEALVELDIAIRAKERSIKI